MNKADLVKAIAAESGLTKKASEAALNAVVASVTKALKEGDKVALIGFGTFMVVKKEARQGINPATKEKITIPARKVVKFKPGTDLDLK